jgi:hypothetical protein
MIIRAKPFFFLAPELNDDRSEQEDHAGKKMTRLHRHNLYPIFWGRRGAPAEQESFSLLIRASPRIQRRSQYRGAPADVETAA